jgi:BirA family transcriptional regulator, biotin operon repressor / biotin---[acetyl-CoA-carboxylase] ligase
MSLQVCPSALPSWLHWLAETPSTNTWAIDHAPQLQHGDVVFTPKQMAGRGQFDRVWQSPPGVLTASFILDEVPLTGLSLAVGLAVIYAIEDLINSPNILQIKWPNDIWHHQRKLAGILCEVHKTRVVVGIGCNLQVDLSATIPNAISLHQLHTLEISELSILTSIRRYLLETAAVLNAKGFIVLLPALTARDALRDRSISVTANGQTISGIGNGFDHQGCLQILRPNQQLQSITSGQVRLFDTLL